MENKKKEENENQNWAPKNTLQKKKVGHQKYFSREKNPAPDQINSISFGKT